MIGFSLFSKFISIQIKRKCFVKNCAQKTMPENKHQHKLSWKKWLSKYLHFHIKYSVNKANILAQLVMGRRESRAEYQ